MSKPRMFVLTAAGRTGLPTALQLLKDGFPVTAFVRREDGRSALLKAQGADVVVGSLTDEHDLRRAMQGARRAYFNAPPEGEQLRVAATFATVAAEQRLETVVAMSQWLAQPDHPSLQTRDTWLGDRLLALLPGTDVITVNPGFFADNDLQPLVFAAQFGLLMLPYGQGRNAPPSNEDMGRVAAALLARPEGHAGKSYRPTGPQLLSGGDMAAILARVLGRPVRYVNAPVPTVLKVMRGFGFSDFLIAQSEQYDRDHQRGAFAVGAPTDVVKRLTGREPEDFETVARRYAARLPGARPGFAARLRLLGQLSLWTLRPGPRTAPHLYRSDPASRSHVRLSADSPGWHHTHDRQVSVQAVGD